MTAIALSGVIGGPVSGWIMKSFDGTNSWHGWQWLFLLEGIPSIVVGIMVFIMLDDRIAKAKWLTAEERELLERNIVADNVEKEDMPIGKMLVEPARVADEPHLLLVRDGPLWRELLAADDHQGDRRHRCAHPSACFPRFRTARRWSRCCSVASSADKRGERRWHIAIPALVGCDRAGALRDLGEQHAARDARLTLGTMGILTTLPLFWSLPTAFLAGTGAAAGIAMINSLGNLAGFLSPYLVGWLKQVTASNSSGMYMLSGFLILGALLVLSVPARTVNR